MISIKVKSKNDALDNKLWPHEISVRPIVGDYIESYDYSKTVAKIVKITHGSRVSLLLEVECEALPQEKST